MSDKVCERCGAKARLRERAVNQRATQRLCRRCANRDGLRRSLAAQESGAGRPTKSPEEKESVRFIIHLTKERAAVLDQFLVDEGYEGSSYSMLKEWANDVGAYHAFLKGEIVVDD